MFSDKFVIFLSTLHRRLRRSPSLCAQAKCTVGAPLSSHGAPTAAPLYTRGSVRAAKLQLEDAGTCEGAMQAQRICAPLHADVMETY